MQADGSNTKESDPTAQGQSVPKVESPAEIDAAVCLGKISKVARLEPRKGSQSIAVLPEGMSYFSQRLENDQTRQIAGRVTHVLGDMKLILIDSCWWVRVRDVPSKDLLGRTVTINAMKERGQLPATTYFATSLVETQMDLPELALNAIGE